MNTPPLLLAGGFLAAGLVGGLAASLFAPTPETAQAADSDVLPAAAAPASAAEVAALRTEVERLADRLAMMGGTDGTLALRTPEGDLPRAAFTEEQLEEAVAAVLTKGGDTAAMSSLVANSLESIRAQEEVERQIERDQRDQQRMQARIDNLTERLGLYPDQATAVLDLYTEMDVKRDELRDQMRNGAGDFASLRDTMRGLQDETDAAMQGILTPEQYTTYDEENLGSFGGRGGFGGGGNRGGGFGG